MVKIATLSLSAALALATGQHALAGAPAALSPALQGKPVVARIHADWCSACKATEATIESIRSKYGAKISFVQFDVTDGKRSAVAAGQAKHAGLSAFFEANKTATSTVAVVNPKTGAIVAKLYGDTQLSDYTSAIDKVTTQLHSK